MIQSSAMPLVVRCMMDRPAHRRDGRIAHAPVGKDVAERGMKIGNLGRQRNRRCYRGMGRIETALRE